MITRKEGRKMDNLANVTNKIQVLDFLLDSLGKVHKSKEKEVEDMTERLSNRKLILMEEAYKLISPLN